jgi:hypothetical protein
MCRQIRALQFLQQQAPASRSAKRPAMLPVMLSPVESDRDIRRTVLQRSK